MSNLMQGYEVLSTTNKRLYLYVSEVVFQNPSLKSILQSDTVVKLIKLKPVFV